MHQDLLGDVIGDDIIELFKGLVLDFSPVIIMLARLSGISVNGLGLILGLGGRVYLFIITHDHTNVSS